MARCTRCSGDVPDGGRFCPACGADLSSKPTSPATLTSLPGQPSAPSSHPSLDDARFLPGTMLADRYRVVGLLGRGGMGEVYRADDLKLGQPVALKFLPPGLEGDRGRLARFLNEVRLARQVSHAAVCRVYDVGEVPSTDSGQGGQHFLSMEYVDGEDLASLLRRIGRLPGDRAVQVARQLCAGLAAAHEQGILHRDLKPANVMLDGRGRVKITDFGLASLEEGPSGIEIRSGTPAYMAPEQVAGKEVTIRSDIYSLGLVLYELFTGKPAFDVAGLTAAELAARRQESTPTSPSSHVEGLDAAVERIILHCLEREPRDRPASALAVAAALPGGDPLAAALAAGETPSPQMVADAGSEGALEPAVAVPCLVLFLVALAATAYLSGQFGLLGRVPLDTPPQALADRARQMVERFGYTDEPADSTYYLWTDSDLLEHVRENDASPSRWDRLRDEAPSPIGFDFRQSPRPLVPRGPGSMVRWRNPPILYSGMTNVELDSEGRLTQFIAVPPHRHESGYDGAPFDWTLAFEMARLDPAEFTAAAPAWTPETYCDDRVSWLGTYPGQDDFAVRVEGCTFHGRPVYFQVLFPWDRPWRMEQREADALEKVTSVVGTTLFIGMLVGALLLARRNLRLGRGDRKGAVRLAVLIFALDMGSWLLLAHHTASSGEIGMFFNTMGRALQSAGMMWLAYVAVEPFVRRRWPDTMVSWARLLAGRFGDPLVGRHLLLGASIGAVLAVVRLLSLLAPGWLGWPPATPHEVDLAGLLGAREVAGYLLVGQFMTLFAPMAYLFLVVLLRVLLRVGWLAFAVFVVLMGFLAVGSTEYAVPAMLTHSLVAGALLFCLVRFGLVATMAAYFFSEFAFHYPLTLDFSTWYAGSSLICLLLPAAVVVYAFRVSLAGRPLVTDALAEG